MKLKLKDEYIDVDQLFGPLPNFKDSFEKFFIQKAANCLFDLNMENKNEINQIKSDQEDSQSSFEFVVTFCLQLKIKK
jgi:hypothetical protein